MPSLTRRATLLLALSTALLPIAARGAASPRATVEALQAGLLAVMRDAQALGVRGRYERLDALLRPAFDFPFMARLAAGAAWGGASPEQRERLADAFARYTAAIYANRFDGYSGERFEILAERPPTANGVMVETRLVQQDGTPVLLNYLLHETPDGWRIADVFLTGTISELATRRSEFAGVVRQGGAAGLIETLEKKITELTGG